MSAYTTEEESYWFAIYTKPRQEYRACANLRSLSLETLFPVIHEKTCNEFTGKVCYVVKPLFLRYIFARFHPDQLLHKVRNTRGVHSVVSFGNKPAQVDDNLIEIICSRMDKDGFVQIGPELKTGDSIVIREGPLRGFTALFERQMNNSERVSILLDTMSYQAHLIVGKDMVKKMSNAI